MKAATAVSGMFGPAFLPVFLTDLIARCAYQIGKSPVLPVIAVGIGASDALLGLIVSVSTATGIALKPLVGYLADRTRLTHWLIASLLLVALPCFFYQFVETPGQLVALRLLHGTATAILGPVTLSLIILGNETRRAEAYGWFGVARHCGYIAGPVIGGALLAFFAPADAYLAAGALGLFAVAPALRLARLPVAAPHAHAPDNRAPARASIGDVLRAFRNRAVLAAAVTEFTTFVSLYFYKAYLPILALRAGVAIFDIGIFLGVQELVTALARPLCGRLADRRDRALVLAAGLAATGGLIICVPLFLETGSYMELAILLGAAQALVQPALQAMISARPGKVLALSFGIVGSFRNAGKVAGPAAGGLLLAATDITTCFLATGVPTLLLGAWLFAAQFARRRNRLKAAKIRMPQPSNRHSA